MQLYREGWISVSPGSVATGSPARGGQTQRSGEPMRSKARLFLSATPIADMAPMFRRRLLIG